MRRPVHALVIVAALVPAVGLVGTGCLGGGTLDARLEAEPVELSARDSLKELRFVAEASTSDVIADGIVSVAVRAGESGESEGQVRVTVGRGDGFMADPAARDDVVQCAPDASVEIPREALAGCQGACREPFVALFAAEGLEPDITVSLPVVLEAQVVYENAIEPGPADFLRLTLAD